MNIINRLRKMGIHARIGKGDQTLAGLKSPTDVNLIKLNTMSLELYPEGKVPQEALDKFVNVLDDSVKQLSNIDGYTFKVITLYDCVARPMRLNRTPMINRDIGEGMSPRHPL
ncbi:hypothetical protein SPFM20_00158 [Salmonella phage SPFM20]|nr:hypothetical protein SPFM20_00158 [Salmonella phage SPFM20]